MLARALGFFPYAVFLLNSLLECGMYSCEFSRCYDIMFDLLFRLCLMLEGFCYIRVGTGKSFSSLSYESSRSSSLDNAW